VINQKFAKIWK